MLKNVIKLNFSIATSFAIVYLLLQVVYEGVPTNDRPSLMLALKNTSLTFVLAYVVLYFITSWVRAYRYRLLIQLSGERQVPSIGQMLMITGVRNMVVDMLPARLGELGYVALLNRAYGVKIEHCISSLTISVAFDFLALFAVIAALILFQFTDAGVHYWAVYALLLSVTLSTLAILGLFAITPWLTERINQRFSKPWPEGSFYNKALSLLNQFTLSITSVRESNQMGAVLATSLAIRVLKYLGFYLLFQAVANPNFPSVSELPIVHIIAILIGGELGASMPIPTLMSFGAYEAGGFFVLSLLGIADQAAAIITILGTHIWSQCIEYTIGGLLLIFIAWGVRRQSHS